MSKSEKIPWWEKTRYVLLILHKDGTSRRIYYDDYDSMSWDAVYLEYSAYTVKARGMELVDNDTRWKTVFRIG